jgi:two-component system CheB/CheR fusion protein
MPERTGETPSGGGDAATPTRVVGLGASAGGVKALKQFFAPAATGTGIAYVGVLHMSPVHESHLAEVLQVSAAMPVITAPPLKTAACVEWFEPSSLATCVTMSYPG